MVQQILTELYLCKKNTTVIKMNSGINMPNDHAIYPKKLGILILFSYAMALTIKFGAFPMYVSAPINTAPAEIAIKSSGGTVPTVV